MGLLTMSDQELTRLDVVQRVLEQRLSQRAAATTLGLSYRQTKRLVARFRSRGASGLVSGQRGRPSNHRLPPAFTDHVIALVREHYADFGPTLAREKLHERHGLVIGRARRCGC
jgi:transposase